MSWTSTRRAMAGAITILWARQRAEPDLGPNVRIRRRASLPFPSSTRQSRAALLSPLSWLGLRGRKAPDVIHVHSFFGLGLEALLDAGCCACRWWAPTTPPSPGSGRIFRSASPRRQVMSCGSTIAAPMSRRRPARFSTSLGAARLRPPCSIVSNPIDTALFAPAPEQRAALKARFGLTGPTIVYAGRLGPEKNIDILLRALAGLARGGWQPVWPLPAMARTSRLCAPWQPSWGSSRG